MSYLNNSMILGRLADEPRLFKTTGTEREVVNFRVMVARPSRDGSRKHHFFDCVCWGKKAEVLSKVGAAGDIIMLNGELVVSESESGERTKILVHNFYVSKSDNSDLL